MTPEAHPDVKGRQTGHPDSLLLRITAFAFLIVALDAWMAHHLGDSVVELLATRIVVPAFGLTSAIAALLGKRKASRYSQDVSTLTMAMLRTDVLISLYALFLIAGSIVTSVSVLSNGTEGQVPVSLAAEGAPEASRARGNLTGADAVTHFTAFTLPFGRAFVMEAGGFQRYSFDLYPWVGKKIRLGSDVTLAPSILFRIPVREQSHLVNGKLEVLSSEEVVAHESTAVKRASVFMGPAAPALRGFREEWNMELIASGITDNSMLARIELEWGQPVVGDTNITFAPGARMEARFVVNGTVVAKKKFRVGDERIQDILLD